MKAHVVSAILVGLVGSGIRLGLAEDVTLLFCVLLVFFAEILNTALEALVDLHTEAFDERARVAKDAAAAGVLVLSIGTILIFGAVLLANWRIIAGAGQQIARQAMAGVPLTAVAAGLLWGARRRWQLDLAMTIAGLVLLAALSTWTANWVFTAVTAGLFATCVAAARYRLTGGSGVPIQAGSGMQTR
jgi:diacylglycerol kinase (ATP)